MPKRTMANILALFLPVKSWRHALRDTIQRRMKRSYRMKKSYEYMLVQQSDFFDDLYYLHHYAPLDSDMAMTPVEHYLRVGWKRGYNPSETFHTNEYLQHYHIHENPLVHFLENGRQRGLICYFHNPFLPDDSLIASYVQHRARRKSRKAVYTCITGDYDNLTQQRYIDFNYDYICFTDNRAWLENAYRGMWEIRPVRELHADNTRINRYHKINAHLILDEYDESIYIDGNINILTSHYFDELKKNENQNMILARHFFRNCLYQECLFLIDRNQYDTDNIKEQVTLMKQDGFPEYYGLSENSIIHRRHHDAQVVKLMEDWWDMVKKYSKRDQCSLAYVLWKNGVNIQDCLCIPNIRHDWKNFALIQHAKSYWPA